MVSPAEFTKLDFAHSFAHSFVANSLSANVIIPFE
jgi:hypothetical protein